MNAENPKQLKILGRELVAMVFFSSTQGFPSHKPYGFSGPICRSAVSIPAKIAEGTARQIKTEFMTFLHVSRGSWREVDTLIELARGVRYLTQEA